MYPNEFSSIKKIEENRVLLKKASSEFMGTSVLVLVGTGTAVLSNNNIGIAMAFGLTLIAMIYTLGSISGGHFNPAVSLAFFLNKRIDMKVLLIYCLSQLIGAVVGSGILLVVLKTSGLSSASLGENTTSHIGIGSSFLVEAILTMLFVFVILSVTNDDTYSTLAGFVIGVTLIAMILVALPLTGASFNPARSFGPALLVGGESLRELLIFIVAPLVGGMFASILNCFFKK